MAVIQKNIRAAGSTNPFPDYTLPSEWETGAQSDFNGTDIQEGICYNDDYGNGINGGVNDYVSVTGWSGTTPTAFGRLTSADGAFTGKQGEGFVIINDGSQQTIQCRDNYHQFVNIRARHENTANNATYGAMTFSNTGASGHVVSNVVLENGQGGRPLYIANGNNSVFENILIVKARQGIAGASGTGPNLTLRNITIIDPTNDAMALPGTGSTTNINNVVANNADYNVGSVSASSSHNASADASAPGTSPVTGITNAVFADYAGGDYSPATGEALDGAGTSPPLLTLDITGATRKNPDDIGAYRVSVATTVKEMYTNISNAWTKATPNLRIGGAWQTVTAYVRSAGAWVKVHDK